MHTCIVNEKHSAYVYMYTLYMYASTYIIYQTYEKNDEALV